MLDLFVVFTTGGLVLFQFQDVTSMLKGNPVNDLIKNVLIEGRGGTEQKFATDKYGLQYRRDNQLDLIFVAVYSKSLESKLTYVAPLLDSLADAFKSHYKDTTDAATFNEVDFVSQFNELRVSAEQSEKSKQLQPKAMKSFEETKKFQTSLAANQPNAKKPAKDPKENRSNNNNNTSNTSNNNMNAGVVITSSDDSDTDADQNDSAAAIDGESDEARARRIKEKQDALRKKQMSKSPKKALSPKAVSPVAKKGKESRQWPMGGNNTGKLDHSSPDSGATDKGTNEAEINKLRAFVGKGGGDVRDMDYEESDEEEEEQVQAVSKTQQPQSSGLFSVFKSFTNGGEITRDALRPVLDKFREHLVGKNVAADIAQKLCESIEDGLVGKTKGTFRGLATVVKETLEKALVQILSPNRRVDILRDVMTAKEKRTPYVIVFCGVNGVGKSTNLSKICYWLLENNLRVMIAACDTFRAGAVEQLKTHERKLTALYPPAADGKARVKLFELGYNKDDAELAARAVQLGRDEGYDVILVDTAGRMQDNEVLMRSLAKLIRVNRPDLVLFVGEALVGNEAVDQLSKFNKALADHSQSDNPRLIDGIVLTKFDTIDDKVGAAISMTYTTGKPIVFVGTGQSYPDLKKLNVKAVVQALLK